MATLKAIFKLFDGYSSTIDKIYRKTNQAIDKILRASGATDEFNEKLAATGAKANEASDRLGKLIGKVLTIAGIMKGMDLADEFTNTAARLDLINDGLQTQAELQDKIFAAADRARGTYNVMADAISRMGLLAGEAFASNDELIAFTELVQKSFKIAGASASEQASAMLQLSQAMAAGRLQGDEFRSIMENAPMIADAIAKYMKKSKGELKELSAEGVITADIIKNAIFMAADDINKKFEAMPMTFGDIWNKIQNRAAKAFTSVMKNVNRIINTEGFNKALDVITSGFELAAMAAESFINAVINGWDTIGPMLWVIGSMLLANLIRKLWDMVPPLIAQISAWYSIHWPILLAIGIIALAISIARQFGATWEQILGFIGGILGLFVTFFYNRFVYMWNIVAAFVNFLGNAFRNPIAAIKALVYDMALTIIGYITTVAKGIETLLNKIPGVTIDITSKLSNLQKKLEKASLTVKSEGELIEYVKRKDFIDYSVGFTKGSNIGKNLLSSFDNALSNFASSLNKGFDLSKFGTSNNPLYVTSKDKIKVDMADEDLKYLRDIAQREYINKFTTATLAPNITVRFGDVHKEADADKLYGRIRKILQEEIAMAAEGVYS